MNPQSTQSQNFLKGIRENWVIILFIGGLIIGWSNFQSRLNASEKTQSEQRAELITIKAEQQELRAAVIESKASFKFIEESIKELKQSK